MNTKTLLSLPVALSLGLAINLSPAVAHDDGLTCHDHPSSTPVTDVTFNFIEIEWDYSEGTLGLAVIGHALDNRVALDRDRYAPDDVVATHASMGEFEEMVGAVRRLVTRAERIADPNEAERALQIAEDTLAQLPLAEYLTIEDFVAENRNLTTVVVPFDVLVRYLKDVGTPDELVAAVQDSAAGC